MRLEDIARFWGKVEIATHNSCWLWQAGVTSTGYGQITIQRRKWKSHRVAWTLTHGAIPKGIFVLHKCDVRRCVNPHHLFLGTALDNARDRDQKGRAKVPSRTGHRNGRAKLTEEDIRTIR